MKITKASITRAINRYRKAVDNNAFDGNIPWDSEGAIQAHEEIYRELENAEKSLRSLIERASQ
jgi:hypothetical protein